MAIVTSASASQGAKAAGIDIPGNKIFGVFRNDFARRMLAASVAAGIEAPIRFYVTEKPDGTATLSYKKPSTVFAPYADEGKDALTTLAAELDGIFEDHGIDHARQLTKVARRQSRAFKRSCVLPFLKRVTDRRPPNERNLSDCRSNLLAGGMNGPSDTRLCASQSRPEPGGS